MILIYFLVCYAIGNIYTSCPNNYFQCKKYDTVKYVSKYWVCDQFNDCLDGSDELNCTIAAKCDKNQFKCTHSSICVDEIKRCNGEIDCPDGSDERNCNSYEKDSCNSYKQYNCGTKWYPNCVDLDTFCSDRHTCNGTVDVEFLCSIDACKHPRNYYRCSHGCVNKYSSFACYCSKGMVLNSNHRTCTVNGKCESHGNICAHICKENGFSYECYCYEGFKRVNNTCLPESSDDEIHLYYQLDNSIIDSNLQTGREEVLISEFQPRTRNVYFLQHPNEFEILTDSIADWNMLRRIKVKANTSPSSMISQFLYVDHSVFTMSADPFHRLLFWSDNEKHTIHSMNLDNYRILQIHDAHTCYYPISIQLDPIRYRIYWIDQGNSHRPPQILSSHYDGSDVVQLVTEYLNKPNSLSIDLWENRLYWSDNSFGSISYIDLNSWDNSAGQFARVNILEDSRFHPFSIVVFENKLYWSDLKHRQIFSINKSNGLYLRNISSISSNNSQFLHIQVFSKSFQKRIQKSISNNQKTQQNICKNCKFGCLPSNSKKPNTHSYICFPEQESINHLTYCNLYQVLGFLMFLIVIYLAILIYINSRTKIGNAKTQIDTKHL